MASSPSGHLWFTYLALAQCLWKTDLKTDNQAGGKNSCKQEQHVGPIYHLALPRSVLTRGPIRMQTLVFSFSSFCSWNEVSPWNSLNLSSLQLTLHSGMNNQRGKQNVDINMQVFLMKRDIMGSLGNKKYRKKMNFVLLLWVVIGNCIRRLKCLSNCMLGLINWQDIIEESGVNIVNICSRELRRFK